MAGVGGRFGRSFPNFGGRPFGWIHRGNLDPWLVVVLLVSFVLNVFHLRWGLPAGNHSWAADALGPVTVLGILHHSFHGWNSGWFYFKYPLGYPFLLASAFAPYLGCLLLSGAWNPAVTSYPYGFSDPAHALFVLSIVGRSLSVAFVLGTVGLTYSIGRRLFGRGVGRLSAWLVATCYPFVYYAHTTNLDAGYVFWLVLALYCAIAAAESRRLLPWVGLGLAAAMAVSTKEQGFAFLLPLPFLALARAARRRETARVWWGPEARAMCLAAVATVVVANNIFYNPLGFVGRIAYLLGHPLAPISARLAPVEFSWFKGARELEYLRQLWDVVDSACGTPLAVMVVAGLLVLCIAPRACAWLVIPVAVHYYLALRGLELITLRYVLPFLVVGAVLAAALLVELHARTRRATVGRAVVAVIVFLGGLGLGRAVELDVLLASDSRYRAEDWLAAHVPRGAAGEVYQKATYLPRLRQRWRVRRVPMDERSVGKLAARQPQFVVLSSASYKSIFSVWNPDWRSTRKLLLPRPEALRLAQDLTAGRAGYRLAAVFRQHPRLLRLHITSLCPEIAIYVRGG